MNKKLHLKKWSNIAEKLLAKKNIDECFDACNKLELLIYEFKNEDNSNVANFYMNKLKNIRLKLNAIIVNELRNSGSGNITQGLSPPKIIKNNNSITSNSN